MENDYDEKVVSFTMDKNLINKVENGSVTGDYIVNKASNVWIHTSLRQIIKQETILVSFLLFL